MLLHRVKWDLVSVHTYTHTCTDLVCMECKSYPASGKTIPLDQSKSAYMQLTPLLFGE